MDAAFASAIQRPALVGHVGNNGDFIAGYPEKVIDFAYRSIHETSTQGKAIVASYYVVLACPGSELKVMGEI